MGRLTEHERFWIKVEATEPEGCWRWVAGDNGHGYGAFPVKRDGLWCRIYAHRYAYELLVGPIPTGMEIDHVCGNRGCVNPAHLEAVTLAENRRRRDNPLPFALVREALPLPPKIEPPVYDRRTPAAARTHCKNGHEYAVTGWRKNGKNRVCAACAVERARRRSDRMRTQPKHGTETHCPHGHEYTPENIYWHKRPNGAKHRECRTCHLNRGRVTV